MEYNELSPDWHYFEGVAKWASYYRANPHRFALDYLGVKLKLFQKILLFMMNISNFFCYIAARGQGKTWLIAVFCCVRAILFPGTKICIAAGTVAQGINVLEKIKNELMAGSANLRREIVDCATQATHPACSFKNGSTIKVVTASDNARGNRANILIVDEFRLVSEDIINTVLRRVLTAPRMPGYLHNPKYAHLAERNKEIYLSSAFFKSHWSFEKVKAFAGNMLDEKKKYFVCGLPYQLSMESGLLSADAVEDEMTEAGFNEIRWSMEMEAIFYGSSENAFFDFDSIAKTRRIQLPMLPASLASKFADPKKVRIPPKVPGEKRVLSADVALMSSTKHKNDATAIFINQLLPTGGNRYINNIVYTLSMEGERTEEQALGIRRLFEEYQCDYIALDCSGLGIGIFDALSRGITDPETGEFYPALSCCNNQLFASRCKTPNAQKAVWAINGSSRFNSECAISLREGFRSGKIRLLVSEYDAPDILGALRGWSSIDPEDQAKIQLPYVNTTLLINELINLKHEVGDGVIRISEKYGMRKDRYSSLAYNFYVACQLEQKLHHVEAETLRTEDIFSCRMFRAPKIK